MVRSWCVGVFVVSHSASAEQGSMEDLHGGAVREQPVANPPGCPPQTLTVLRVFQSVECSLHVLQHLRRDYLRYPGVPLRPPYRRAVVGAPDKEREPGCGVVR
jgi:hypothetical protein